MTLMDKIVTALRVHQREIRRLTQKTEVYDSQIGELQRTVRNLSSQVETLQRMNNERNSG